MKSWTMDLNSSATWNHKKIQALQNQSPCVYKSPIPTTHRMYSHVKGTISISFVLIIYVDMDTHDTIPIMMTIGRPTIMVFASTTLPPNLGPPRGSPRITRRFVVPSTRPYRRLLNYLEYKNILINKCSCESI